MYSSLQIKRLDECMSRNTAVNAPPKYCISPRILFGQKIWSTLFGRYLIFSGVEFLFGLLCGRKAGVI